MRYLKPLKRNHKARKKRFAVFDIETRGGLCGKFEMLGFFDGKNEKIFGTVEEFLEYVLTYRYRGYSFYAHNADRFDFKFIIEPLFDFEIADDEIEINNKIMKIKIISIGEKINEIQVIDSSRHIYRFIDSFSLLPVSLREAAECFGCEHRKTEIDYDEISIDDKKSREYCLNDCKVLYEVLEKYFQQEIFKGLDVKNTVASNAMQIFRVLNKKRIDVTSRELDKFIRLSYYGGRVEVFKMYGSRLNMYDYNSMYPSIMASFDYPIGDAVYTDSIDYDFPGFYHAVVDVPYMYVPCLPIICKGKLIFPYGIFEGVFVSCELSILRKLGGRIKIKKGIIFRRTAKIFDDYVSEFFRIKRNSSKKSASYLIAKLYLNGLYGKFGQREEQECIVRCSMENAAKNGYEIYIPELNLYIEKKVVKRAYMLPHIASWTTALGRVKLWRTLAKTDPYYCDTDSLFVRGELDTSDRLGELKYEGKINYGIFLLPKVYGYYNGRWNAKIKGFDQVFREKITENDFLSALEGDFSGFEITQKKLLGIKESWKRFKKTPVVENVKKSLVGEYDKRIVVKDYDTRPIELNNAVCDRLT